VKAAETSRSSSSTGSGSAGASSSKPAGGNASASGGGQKSSLYDKTVQEVTTNPMVQAAAASAMMTGVSAGLFDSKLPGLSSTANSSANKTASSDQPALREGEIPTSIDVDPSELEEMKKWAAKLRITNLVVSTLLMLASFFSLGSTDLTLVFIAIYVFFFSLLLCCYELGLQAIAQVIAQNFGFVYNTIPRRIFIVLIAILCFELGLIGKISMGILLASESVHAYVLFKHPKFNYYMKLKHFYGVHDPTPRTNAVEEV
jgi:hypothetical protein